MLERRGSTRRWLPILPAPRRNGGRARDLRWTGRARLLVGGRDGVTVLPLGEIASLRYVPHEAGSVSAAGAGSMGVLGLILAVFAIGSATAGHVGSGLFIVPSTPGRKSLQVFGIGKKDAEDWMLQDRRGSAGDQGPRVIRPPGRGCGGAREGASDGTACRTGLPVLPRQWPVG